MWLTFKSQQQCPLPQLCVFRNRQPSLHTLATNPRSHFVTAVQVATQAPQKRQSRLWHYKTVFKPFLRLPKDKVDVMHACLA